EPKPSLEERAAALFVETPATSRAEPAVVEAPSTAPERHAAPEPPREPRTESFIPPRVQRPAPARPRPVASAAPGASAAPPRPIASAAPGESTDDRRRDKKKR